MLFEDMLPFFLEVLLFPCFLKIWIWQIAYYLDASVHFPFQDDELSPPFLVLLFLKGSSVLDGSLLDVQLVAPVRLRVPSVILLHRLVPQLLRPPPVSTFVFYAGRANFNPRLVICSYFNTRDKRRIKFPPIICSTSLLENPFFIKSSRR